MNDDFRRRLAAVLCADVAGYTRLMAGDENATHAAYKACLNEVVLPALGARRGRIVKSTGDGFIAVFDSVVDGMSCALAIQEGVARLDAAARLPFRIGVNVGDILVEEEDVYGDGVNVAARLQALAAPGGVCVSALVRDQIRGKLPLTFESLGRKRVKKNDELLDVYAVHAQTAVRGGPVAARLTALARSLRRRGAVIGFACAAICAIGIAAWQADVLPVQLASLVEGTEPSRLALPDRPSLVVLPFRIIGTGDDQEYFADGITEDVITDLARIGGLFVISRTSSFAYKGRPVDVRKIGRELGVRYALEGSVRRSDDTVRIDAKLIDAQSGGHLWAARFDRPLGDVFKIQDEITQKIVQALSVNIGQRERAAHTASMAAYDAYLRGWAYYRNNTFVDHQKAIEYFESAIAIDPGFAQAHAAIAAAKLAARLYSWTNVDKFDSDSPLRAVLNARRHDEELLASARQHLSLAMHSPSSLAYRSSAEILIFERRFDEAIEEIRKAIGLDPNDADNFALMSAALVWTGKAEAAIEPIERAIRLNPYHPPIYLCHYGTALFSLARYADAAARFEACKTGNPANQFPYVFLIATYAYLGEDRKAEGAREGLAELLQRQGRSPFSVKEARSRMPYRYQADLLRLLIGLHKANVLNSLDLEQ